MRSLRLLLLEQTAVLTQGRTGPRNFGDPHCRVSYELEGSTPHQGGEWKRRHRRLCLHLFCSPVLDGGERMCKSLGTAVRECAWRKTVVIKYSCDYSLQRTSILMGKQHNLYNSELLTLCSCWRFQNNSRLRFGAGYEGIYRLSVFVWVFVFFSGSQIRTPASILTNKQPILGQKNSFSCTCF